MNIAKSETIMSVEVCDGLPLRGLDGANPLGFLAALGLLRVLGEACGPVDLRMSWVPSGGTWAPVLHSSAGPPLEEDALLTSLTQQLVNVIEDHPANLLGQLDSVSGDGPARRRLIREIAIGSDRTRMDWASAIASDFAPPDSINQLQTTRRDYFFGNLSSVISRTNREHLRRAVFHPWDYSDALDNQSLHLDPSEDRRHAHRVEQARRRPRPQNARRHAWREPPGPGGHPAIPILPRGEHAAHRRLHGNPEHEHAMDLAPLERQALPPHRAIVPRLAGPPEGPIGRRRYRLAEGPGSHRRVPDTPHPRGKNAQLHPCPVHRLSEALNGHFAGP